MYRKNYSEAVVIFICSLVLVVAILGLGDLLILLYCGAYGKYFFCKRFLANLELKNDEILAANGGVNEIAIYVIVIASFVLFIAKLISQNF